MVHVKALYFPRTFTCAFSSLPGFALGFFGRRCCSLRSRCSKAVLFGFLCETTGLLAGSLSAVGFAFSRSVSVRILYFFSLGFHSIYLDCFFAFTIGN